MTATYDLRDPGHRGPAQLEKFPASSYASRRATTAATSRSSPGPPARSTGNNWSASAEVLLEAYTRGAAVFSCGNGGSAAIANHLQCDHLKGIRAHTELSPRVVSLSTNVELLTAIANDIGYEEVFAYQLQSQARPGDVLIAISSSGRSANIVQALEWAHEHGLRTIAFTGFDGGGARVLAEIPLHVDCSNYGVIEDLHQALMHALAQYICQSRMGAGTVAATTF